VSWLGANPAVETQTGKAIQGVDNYYTTVCPDGVLGVRSFESIQFTNLYEGIDLKYYEHDGHMKYDYLVSPGADYQQIKLEYKGATSLSIDKEGNLLIETPIGTLYEPLPLVTQYGKQLEANWELKGDVVSFQVADYDPTQDLIIDPLVRVWGTYYGGEKDDRFFSIESDSTGDIYSVGYTMSLNNIASNGAFQTVIGNALNNFDGILVKFDINGNRIFGTYYGGELDEFFGDVSIDSTGNVFVIGYSNSLNGISTIGSHQPNFAGWIDGILIKFNSTGNRVFGTYYGGSGDDEFTSIQLDNIGNVYVVGSTDSQTNIATSGSQQEIHANSSNWGLDAFIVKFSNSGIRLWGTYYGGEGTDDRLESVYISPDGFVYVGGYTNSSSGIVTNGSYQTTLNGISDGFYAKFNFNGIREYGSFYGGEAGDQIEGLICDALGNIYLSGMTFSQTGIATAGSYQSSISIDISNSIFPEIFLIKMNANGSREWGTYYGGDLFDFGGHGMSFYQSNKICLVGATMSQYNISSLGAYQPLLSSPGNVVWDGFLALFTTDGDFEYGTYIGGLGDDLLTGVSCLNNSIYVCGYSYGSVNIPSLNCYQSSINGDFDGVIMKFNNECNANCDVYFTQNDICEGDTTEISCSLAETYFWSNGLTSPSIIVASPGAYYCQITDSLGCMGYSDTIQISNFPITNINISGNTSINYTESTQLFASGGENYSWQPPTGLSCTDCADPIVQPTVPTQYTVTVTDSNGCVNTKTVFVNIKTDGCIYIPNIFSPNTDSKNDEFCLYGSCLKSGTFTIYNRWGEKVFETTDMKQCWDGTYKGEPVSGDVFVYKLSGVLVTGEVVEESGNIEVVK